MTATAYPVVVATTPCVPVGQEEIAERLGVKPATVRQWRFRGLLPEPLGTVSGLPAWNWPTIEEWARETGRMQ